MNNKEKEILASLARFNNTAIDCDKLTEAIIKSEMKALEMKAESEKEEKQGFFKAIGSILKGKRSKDGRFLYAPYVLIISVLYRVIAIMGWLSLVPYVRVCKDYYLAMVWRSDTIINNIFLVSFAIILFIVIFLYMLMFWGAANDMEYEKDKDYVINVFTGLVSVAALIIAIIALNR